MFCSIYSFVNKEKSIFIKDSLISKENLYFNIFAGFPPTIAYGGTSFTTTAPAATKHHVQLSLLIKSKH